MTTPSEQKALAFLAALTLLGSAVRAVRAHGGAPGPDSAAAAALREQIAAVDSARAAQAERQQIARSRRRGAPSVGGARSTSPARATPPAVMVAPLPAAKVDLDVASAAEIERLPRIGPVLAKRVVVDRDSLGPFGSLEGFQRVKGVGPSVAKALAPHVTFSGTPRQFHVNERDRDTPGRTRSRPRPRPP